ncbi:MAG: hypothetical protein WCD50_13535, partial [Onishia taeanensis]|uniref:hypothetical protein n=1 Tax=Onishia taeanensis TaxID=284577 RepID=UPI003C7E1C41
TSTMSTWRSNQLSYGPAFFAAWRAFIASATETYSTHHLAECKPILKKNSRQLNRLAKSHPQSATT